VLALTAGGAAVCAVFAVVTYSIARGSLTEQRLEVALRQAYTGANFLRSQLATNGTTPAEALAALNPEGGTAVLVERRGRWVSSELDVAPDVVPAAVREHVAAGRVAHAPGRWRDAPVLVVGVPLASVDAAVYEIAPVAELQSTLRVLSTVLSLGTVLGTALAAMLGLWARRRVLQPLQPIATTAAAIASGDLGRRLADTDDPDLVSMVAAFNSMVDALHQRIERDARFVADVSHELRSPLTTLVASVDLLDARAASLPPRSRQLVELVSAELDRFRHLLEALLELARSEAAAALDDAEPVDVRAFVAAVLRRSDRPADLLQGGDGDRAPAVVLGDRLALERALTNLLDNADRHGGGATGVGVHREDGLVSIVVDDDGPGVPVADRERVFERFATGGGPRGSGSGAGLGLSLVSEIARAHRGSAWCTAGPSGGARFVLRLPEHR
jgi:signal transduction histidine kinase